MPLSISCVPGDRSRPVILNRGPHGPPGGNLQVLGRNTEHLGNWGGMDPFGGNRQIAIKLIAQDVLLAGVLWRLHQCLLMLHYDLSRLRAVAHYHRTQCPDQNGHWAYEGQHFWLRGIHTSDKNGNACIIGTTNFKISFKIWLLMHMTAYTGKVPWPSSATARGLGGGE